MNRFNFRTKIKLKIIVVFCALTSATFCSPLFNRSGQTGLQYTSSAEMMGMGRVSINANNQMTFKGLLDSIDLRDTAGIRTPEYFLYSLTPSLSIGVAPFLDFSVMLPIYFDNILNSVSYPGQSGIGDLEIGLKLGSGNSRHPDFTEYGLLTSLSLPTGEKEQGYFPKHIYYFDKDSAHDTSKTDYPYSYFSSKSTELETRLLFTIDPMKRSYESVLLMHLNGGFRFIFNDHIDNILLYSAGIEVHPVKWFALGADYSGEVRLGSILDKVPFTSDPMRITPSLSFLIPGGLNLTFASSFSLSSDTMLRYPSSHSSDDRFVARSEPRWNIGMSLGWNGYPGKQDADKDDIVDKMDRCPYNAEDIDGFEDSDGCPDVDNDNDGIDDENDKCPGKAEDMDGFEDSDGCPEPDNDLDHIPDSLDLCKQSPEDHDGYQDEDGCPEYDNDNDGVADSVDRCINIPEDRDGFLDKDGCPDSDNDQDGIADSLDRCPDDYGTIEKKGCGGGQAPAPGPIKEIKRGRVILKGVDFESANAVLLPASFEALDKLYSSLVTFQHIRIEVRGHTDNRCKHEDCLVVSKSRADAVRNYLIGKGIEAGRVIVSGKGDLEPINDNLIPQGRIQNNRIEIFRID